MLCKAMAVVSWVSKMVVLRRSIASSAMRLCWPSLAVMGSTVCCLYLESSGGEPGGQPSNSAAECQGAQRWCEAEGVEWKCSVIVFLLRQRGILSRKGQLASFESVKYQHAWRSVSQVVDGPVDALDFRCDVRKLQYFPRLRAQR